MKSTQVKSHKRKGRVVKSHSRAVKGAMKNSGSGMSAEECKAKYDAMVAKYGENSPQAKKLAMKMDGMETVEKEAKKKYTGTPEQQRIKAMKATGIKRKPIRPTNGFTAEELKKAVLKKHSRGDYMRKNVEEELLTKEAKKKHARTVKKGGKWVSSGVGSNAETGKDYVNEYKKGNAHRNINTKTENLSIVGGSKRTANGTKIKKAYSGEFARLEDFRSDSIGKTHSTYGRGNKAKKRTGLAKKK